MLAIAVADRLERSLYLARDRLGEKPLYVWTAPSGDVVFASELKAITCYPDFRCEIDPVIGGYLLLNYVPGKSMLLRGVERLAPGSWCLLHLDGRRTDAAYWSPIRAARSMSAHPRAASLRSTKLLAGSTKPCVSRCAATFR